MKTSTIIRIIFLSLLVLAIIITVAEVMRQKELTSKQYWYISHNLDDLPDMKYPMYLITVAAVIYVFADAKFLISIAKKIKLQYYLMVLAVIITTVLFIIFTK